MDDRFWIAVRADLAPGLQLAQVAHAALAAAPNLRGGGVTYTVAVVHVPNEAQLVALEAELRYRAAWYVTFREPDLRFAPTAVAFGGRRAVALARALPLAFSPP